MVHVRPVTTSLAVIVRMTFCVAFAYPELPLLDITMLDSVGVVASCVNANCVGVAVFVLPAGSEIAPATTSMVTDSSASVGVKVYVHTVSELEAAPLPTDPPVRARVGAADSASEAVTITE